MDKNLRPYLAELIGTFTFVFLSAGAVCVNQLAAMGFNRPGLDISQTPPGFVAHALANGLGIALVTGFAYAATLAMTLPLSGGYLNPAVPLMLWVFKRLDGVKTTWLIGSQLLGAAVAGLLLRLLLSFQENALVAASLGTPHLNLEAFGTGTVSIGPLLRGIAIELVLTFFLVFAIFGTVLDPRAPRWGSGWVHRLAALWLGLIVVAATLVGFNLTGAALNPARWFGPVVWEMTVVPLLTQHPFRDHAIYWIGPLVGALVAGALYTNLVLPPEKEEHAPLEASATAGRGAVTSTLYRSRR